MGRCIPYPDPNPNLARHPSPPHPPFPANCARHPPHRPNPSSPGATVSLRTCPAQPPQGFTTLDLSANLIMADAANKQPEVETFSERAPVADAMTSAGASAGAGLLVSAVQNSMQNHNKGAFGVFTRTGSTIAIFTAMGGIFSFTDSTVANFRQKSDAINGAAGGCAAGLVLGAGARSLPMMVGSCAALAALIGTFDAAGRSLQGTYARASPLDYTNANQHGVAAEGTAAPGERGWREEREARRQSFFKQKKSADIEESD
ncbi:hypothetical protein ACQY0O_000874 [Thecaphora frezii]